MKYKKKDVIKISVTRFLVFVIVMWAAIGCSHPYETFCEDITNRKYAANGMATSFTLFQGTGIDIKDERITIEFKCENDNNYKKIAATGEYYHCKVNKNYSPGISIGVDGISLSLSKSWAEIYNLVNNNPGVIFNVK